VAEYGEIPDLSGMPLVKPHARPPSHLNLRLIEDLTPKEKAERSTPPAHWVDRTGGLARGFGEWSLQDDGTIPPRSKRAT
jgi:hypothetical protein